VSHAALLEAVQPQPPTAVTVTVPPPADASTFADAGAIVELHGTPACVTLKVWPPTVSVPVRGVVVVFAATLYPAEPLPLPDAPEVIVIHPALLVEVHAQPVAAVTVIVPELATSETLADAGAIVGEHGAPACVTVNVLPPTVRVPVRGLVVGLAVRL
jgi:hypothetical protein